MQPPVELTVKEASRRLGVTPRRVRAMIQHGELEAVKVGGVWLISPASIAHRLGAKVSEGRRLSPNNAWALLWIKSGDPSLERITDQWISNWTRWYLKGRARREHWERLAPRLGRRAAVHRMRAHPSDLARLVEEPGVVRTGVSAAQTYRLDIDAPGVVEAYVSAKQLPTLRKKYLLAPSTSPNVILHVVDDPWPFPLHQKVAPAFVAALDLLDSDDRRSQRAAIEFLEDQWMP